MMRNALLFPRLSKLEIWYCPLLTSFPMFPHLKEELLLLNARWKVVQQTITNASSSASSTPIAFSSPPLSKLRYIFLREIKDLETLPEDGLQNLVSLQYLKIKRCPKFKSIPQGVQYLTALQNLELFDCPMLDLGNDEHVMQWKGLKSLISLNFQSIPKLVSLPLGLQHVTTLQELRISDCSSLMTMPEWICNWASLERFTISRCSGLTSLPEAMSRLTSLKVLTIHDCPILLQRCEQDGGEDWPKIAHIPKLEYFDPQLEYN
ncbi:putative disease resistance protein RGA4 [Juglans regia]|uniref:Disease resistance protein RGA4 n=1 Tax=Juglans regia TaxID=51240 RepID=A0A6P9E145_JUGRE|nr:putative disease resistance protein RGA4 [Juglans regia]